MKILAIDTSTTHSSCSVMEDNNIVGDFSINQSMSHNEILLVMVDEVLKKLNIDIEDIDLFVAVTGPGSFTGIRIGVTVVKALAMALNKPIVAVNTLEALSFGVFSDKKKIPLIDARGERVYYGVYEGINNKNIGVGRMRELRSARLPRTGTSRRKARSLRFRIWSSANRTLSAALMLASQRSGRIARLGKEAIERT